MVRRIYAVVYHMECRQEVYSAKIHTLLLLVQGYGDLAWLLRFESPLYIPAATR